LNWSQAFGKSDRLVVADRALSKNGVCWGFDVLQRGSTKLFSFNFLRNKKGFRDMMFTNNKRRRCVTHV